MFPFARKAIMHIITSELVIIDYVTATDRSLLQTVLGLMPKAQSYIEAASDGVTFVDSYLSPAMSIQISPPKGREFGTSDVLDIIRMSPVHFGERDELEPHIRGKLDAGIVLAETVWYLDSVLPIGETFAQLRREVLEEHTTRRADLKVVTDRT